MKISFSLAALAVLGVIAAFANVPDVRGMYGWQLEMQFFRAGEGPIGKPVAIACQTRWVKDPHDCLDNGLFLTAKECKAASKVGRRIDLYSKPPGGPNDWYGSVFVCVHRVTGAST